MIDATESNPELHLMLQAWSQEEGKDVVFTRKTSPESKILTYFGIVYNSRFPPIEIDFLIRGDSNKVYG